MLISQTLYDFEKLSSLSLISLVLELGDVRINKFGIPFRDVVLLATFFPHFLHYRQDILINLPRNFGEII